ncbi:Nn.00g106090.m01.CDS01 [Neocucurbitaria sp. VM-36]
MTNPPFTFGAGATHSFSGVNTGYSLPAGSAPGTTTMAAQAVPASIEDVLREELAERMAQLGDLGVALARAERAATVAQSAEKVAREALNGLRNNYKTEKQRAMEDYERVAKLQSELETLTVARDNLRKDYIKLQGVHKDTTASLQSQEQQVTEKDSQLASLRDTVEKLKKDVDDEKAATASHASSLENAYADLTDASNACKAAVKARDEAEARQQDTQLQFDSLRAQWESSQDRIEELEGQLDAIQDLEKENAGLMDDMDNLRTQLADHERTLIVKDERISHLETQFQKERQRNLNAADAAAAAAATSPIDEPPQPFNSLGDSLEEELAATSDYDESVYEPLEYSHVIEIAAFEPVKPASGPTPTLNVVEAASVAPVQAAIPTLTVNVDEAATVTPIEPHISTTASFTQTDPHVLTTEILQHAALDTVPLAPAEITSSTTSTQTHHPKLTVDIIDSAIINVSPISVQTTMSNPKITLTPIMVTHEERPLEELVAKCPTTSVAAQTTELHEATEANTPVILPLKSKKLTFFDTVLPVLATLLAFFCLTLYTELQAWKTANGVGYRHGYGNNYDRTGAYGNGRYLFGFIPLAMDVGTSWWSEPLARSMSVAITRLESWAGITYTPLY